MKQIFPDELVWESGIRIYSDFFPTALLDEMANETLTQAERKVVHTTLDGNPFPEPFDGAAKHIVNYVYTAINTVISKRYEPEAPSTAFELHHDPETFDNQLILCSLGGHAILTILDMNIGHIDINCVKNTVVTLPTSGIAKLHKVTPPSPGTGPRPFAFFGHQHP